MENKIKTDMAVELVNKYKKKSNSDGANVSVFKFGDVTKTKVVLTTHNDYGKPAGSYITIDAPLYDKDCGQDTVDKVKLLIENEIKFFVGSKKNVLIIGIGNEELTSDSLGPKTIDKIIVSRGIDGKLLKSFKKSEPIVSKFAPNVLGNTGIESLEMIYSLIQKVKPDMVIVIDSLCARSVGRIGQSFQIADSGIVPGSGVGNVQKEISFASLKVPVLAIGVPTVVYGHSLVLDVNNDFLSDDENSEFVDFLHQKLGDLVVAPKEIDIIIDYCSKIISDSINNCFFRK